MSKTGIYKIYNAESKKEYIGSALNIRTRWNKHNSQLRLGKHHNPILQKAWNKYGEGAFEFILLEECNSEELLVKEQQYLDQVSAEMRYNIIQKVEEGFRGRKHTEEAKEKMRQAHLGRVWTKEHKENLQKALKGRKYSQEGKKRLSESRKKTYAAGNSSLCEVNKEQKGSKNPNSVLTEGKVAEIKTKYLMGYRIAQLAREYGTGWTTIHNVVAGRTWKDVSAREGLFDV